MTTMHSPLLPEWSRLLWAVLLGGVAALHFGHVLGMSGQRRWWHTGHTLMAVAMAAMYVLPRMSHPLLYRGALALFALLTVVMACATGVIRYREGVLNPLWAASTVDVLAMSYMLVPSARPWPLTYLFVAYLAVQTVAWALGWWQRFPVLRTAGAGPDMIDSTGQGRAVALTAHSTRTVPVSLAVMAAGMAYMLVAM